MRGFSTGQRRNELRSIMTQVTELGSLTFAVSLRENTNIFTLFDVDKNTCGDDLGEVSLREKYT